MKLWSGQAVSAFGNQITAVALPLLAVFYLQATPAQLGVLGAVQFAPYLAFGLLAGVWVDRLRRRPLMLAADLIRALCIGAVPLLGALHLLHIGILYALIFVFGVLSLFFDVSYQSYFPSLVGKSQLIDGNAKLQSTDTVAQVAGPTIAGWLVALVSAPFVFVIDAATFLVSALSLAIVKKREPSITTDRVDRNLRAELRDGLQFVIRDRFLRIIALSTGTSNLFGRILFTVYPLFLAHTLHLGPAQIGLTFTASSVGAVLGVLVAARAAKTLGLGRAIAWSLILGNTTLILIPLAGATAGATIPLILVGMFLWGISNPVYNINQVGLRQHITPNRLLGRMNASMRFLVWGTVPIGYVVGGGLGTWLGLWPTMIIGAVGGVLPVLWLLPSALAKLKTMPAEASEPSRAEASA